MLDANTYRDIQLSQGQVAKVSPERFEELSQFNWYAQWNSNTQSFYAVRHAVRLRGEFAREG